jgi:hypothetical protein
MPVFDTDEPVPNWPLADRCDWWLEMCGGAVSCALKDGHDLVGAAVLGSRLRWHRTWGETWLHAWTEADDDAYRRAG